MILSMQRQDVL